MFRRRDDWATRMAVGAGAGYANWARDRGQPLAGTTEWVGGAGASALEDDTEPLVLVRALDGEREVLVAGRAIPMVDSGERMDAQAAVASSEWRQSCLRL